MNGTQEDEMLDIEEYLRPVARKHGRGIFALVMHAGLARQAAEVLSAAARKNAQTLYALQTLAQAFNHVSDALAKREGWSEQMLHECDRDVQLTFQGKLLVPKIVLAH